MGLQTLADKQAKVRWVDFDEIVTYFDNLAKDSRYTIVAYEGLGEKIVKAFEDNPEWTSIDCQRFVGVQLAQALNGMLREGA